MKSLSPLLILISTLCSISLTATAQSTGQNNFDTQLQNAINLITQIDDDAEDCQGIYMNTKIPYRDKIIPNLQSLDSLVKLYKINPQDHRVSFHYLAAVVYLDQVYECSKKVLNRLQDLSNAPNRIYIADLYDSALVTNYIKRAISLAEQAQDFKMFNLAHLYAGRYHLDVEGMRVSSPGYNLKNAIKHYEVVLLPENQKYINKNLLFLANRNAGRAYFHLFELGGGGVTMPQEEGQVKRNFLSSQELYQRALTKLNRASSIYPNDITVHNYLVRLEETARMFPFYNQ